MLGQTWCNTGYKATLCSRTNSHQSFLKYMDTSTASVDAPTPPAPYLRAQRSPLTHSYS